MLTLFLFLCLLPSGNPQAEQQPPLTPDDGYLLPKYPALAARAFVNADYELSLEIEQGSVKSMKITSGPTGEAGLGKDFIASMDKAFGKWRFQTESGIWYVKVTFRSFPTNAEEGKPTYYVYRVDGRVDRITVSGINGTDFRVPKLPSEIIVEYHFPIPELHPDFLPSKKRWWLPF